MKTFLRIIQMRCGVPSRVPFKILNINLYVEKASQEFSLYVWFKITDSAKAKL